MGKKNFSDEKWFKIFSENLGVALIIDPENGSIIDANKSAEEFYGWTIDELKLMKISDINMLSDDEIFHEMSNAKNNRKTFFYFRHRIKDGTIKNVEVESIPCEIEGRNYLCSIVKKFLNEKLSDIKKGEYLDVSKYVDFGENIQRIKMGYRRIFEEVPVSVIILDENLGVMDLNKKAEETFGWKKENLIGNYILRYLVKSKDFHDYKITMDNVLQGNDSEILNENITSSGKTILCHWYNRPVKNTDGNVHLIISMAQDVTGEIEKEKHLRMLESAVEQSTGSVIIVNTNGIIEYVNTKYKEISGFSLKEVVGCHVREIRTDVQDNSVFADLWNHLDESKEWNGEINYIKKDGGNFWTKTKIFPAFDLNGDKINYISINEDITEERKESEKFNRINRTLIDQEKMASIGQMAAGIVHEINNPLSYISTNIFSLKDMISDDEFIITKEFMEDLTDILNDVEVGINDIKQIANSLKRFSFRNIKEEKQMVNLNEEIRNTLIVSKNEYKYYANLSFHDDGDIYVYGYSGQLRQVFLNMIINSVYAIRKKHKNEMGNIDISIYENLDFAYVKFSDDGTGIKDENKNKIFEPFFTTKAEGEGTGLGLNITWDIIKNKHNGDIFVDGKYGEGATFIIRLPKGQNED